MTLNISTRGWGKPALLTFLLVSILGIWSTLAGGIFLISQGLDFNDASPLTLYRYWYHYGALEAIRDWTFYSLAIAFTVIASPFALVFAPAKKALYGKARFATMREIRKSGLLGDRGVIVGRIGNWLFGYQYLIYDGSQHIMLSAPTRSGKGVGFVIPNLLHWPDSVVVLDMKQENWDLTSAYRRKYKQACFLFAPAARNYRTHRYNPLFYISEDPNFRIDDIQKIGNMLFPDRQGTDPIWTATPRSLFLGLVLMLIETPGKLVTIGQVLRETLADGDCAKYLKRTITMRALGEQIVNASAEEAQARAKADFTLVMSDKGKAPGHHPRMAEMAVWVAKSASYRAMLAELQRVATEANAETPDILAIADSTWYDTDSVGVGKALSPACVRALSTFTSIEADTTRGGIIGSFRSRLELWNNPLIDAATSGNDFDLRDVRKKKMSIYIGVSPDNLERLSPLINLFYQQLIDLNSRELPSQNKAIKHHVLLLMDEFTAPGKISALSHGISHLAGYWVRVAAIFQAHTQVIGTYGQEAATTYRSNQGLEIIFPPKATETKAAEEISKWLGYETVKGRSRSRGLGFFGRNKSSSENVSDQRRELLLPQEITALPKSKQFVVAEEIPPIKARKIVYYSDHTFMDRLKSVSPTLRKAGRRIPKEKELKEAWARGELSAPVPIIDVDAHMIRVAKGGAEAANQSSVTGVVIESRTVAISADDVPNLGRLALDSFAVDFGAVAVPSQGSLDVTALQAYADALCVAAGVTPVVAAPKAA